MKLPKDISAWGLRLLAMGFMVLDHMWATIIPGQTWMTMLGRLAYPIFAFLLAEGFRHTGSFPKYWKRMAIFAVISEIPFNLMGYGMPIFPFHQNVLWTFCLALFAMKTLNLIRQKAPAWLFWLLGAATAWAFYLAGTLAMVDYGGWGIMTVLVFYLFPGEKPWQKAVQLLCLYFINWQFMGSMRLPLGNFEFPVQGLAVLALPLIWMYRGRQGLHNQFTKWLGYWFYPVHALILGLLYL